MELEDFDRPRRNWPTLSIWSNPLHALQEAWALVHEDPASYELSGKSYQELQTEFARDRRAHLQKKLGYAYYVVLGKPAKNGESPPPILAVGTHAEIWPLWPQTAEDLVVTPRQASPGVWDLDYVDDGVDRTKTFSLTFDKGEPMEPKELPEAPVARV
jgi:hypothetical protein